jgi:hypothetical protein
VAGLGEAVEEAVAGLEPEATAEGHPARDATAGTPATS